MQAAPPPPPPPAAPVPQVAQPPYDPLGVADLVATAAPGWSAFPQLNISHCAKCHLVCLFLVCMDTTAL